MGKPAATDRQRLQSLSHSFTLDARAVFETEDDARRFLRVLPVRLGKFGLRLNTQKTHLVAFGKRRAWQVARGGGRMSTVDFLGFTH